MVDLLSNIRYSNLTLLDRCNKVYPEASFYLPRLDVYVKKWLEKSQLTFQNLVFYHKGIMFIKKTWKQNQNWETFAFSISRIVAYATVAFRSRHCEEVIKEMIISISD